MYRAWLKAAFSLAPPYPILGVLKDKEDLVAI